MTATDSPPAPPERDAFIGRIVGNYVVRERIGTGASAAVYRAEHRHIARTAAMKILHPHLSHAPEIRSRFVGEARAVSAIHHEHVVEILDFGESDDGTLYLAMEWLVGRSLAAELAAHGPLPLGRALHIVGGIGQALAAAHAQGIVHRDLKPENVFLVARENDRDFVKVLDFGIAKLLHPEAGVARTQAGMIWGTPSYMSPEQCRGASEEIDQRSDLYSLGVIVHELLSGALPFTAENIGEVLIAHVTQPPPSLRTLNPTLPAGIAGAVLQALEKDRAHRFARVEDFVAALHVPAAPTPPARQPRSSRAWLLLGAAALLVLLLAIVLLTMPRQQKRPVPALPVVVTPVAPVLAAPPSGATIVPATPSAPRPTSKHAPAKRGRSSELITEYPQ
jgi:serine/threonine-protein kinase